MTPEEYIELAEDILASAKSTADRGYDSPSIEAYANRAAALSNIAHAYISLAQTVAINRAADAQVVTATKFAQTPNYGTPSAPAVPDPAIQDAPTHGRSTDHEGTPFSDNIDHFYVEMRIDAEMNYSDASDLCKELFPRFSVEDLDVEPTTSSPDQKATFLAFRLGY